MLSALGRDFVPRTRKIAFGLCKVAKSGEPLLTPIRRTSVQQFPQQASWMSLGDVPVVGRATPTLRSLLLRICDSSPAGPWWEPRWHGCCPPLLLDSRTLVASVDDERPTTRNTDGCSWLKAISNSCGSTTVETAIRNKCIHLM